MRPYEGACPHSKLTQASPSIQPRGHKSSRLGVGNFFSLCSSVFFFLFNTATSEISECRALPESSPHLCSCGRHLPADDGHRAQPVLRHQVMPGFKCAMGDFWSSDVKQQCIYD